MAIEGDKIIINEWVSGIGASSAQGFGDMRSFDPFRKPGYLELSLELVNEADTPFSLNFTANATTDLLTVTGGTISRVGGSGTGVLKAVKFISTGTLPAGLSTNTIYFITDNGSATSTVFNVSTTLALAQANSFVNITDTGTGTHTITTVNMDKPVYFRVDSSATLYMQDASARIWFRTTTGFWYLLMGNTITGAGADTGGTPAAGSSGKGLAIWKNYLFAFRDTTIDVWNIANATPSGWSNSWKSTNSGASGGGNSVDHFPFVSKDGKLYFYADYVLGVKYYIGSLKQETTFAPGTPATYTYNATALDIPDVVTSLSDFNSSIMIGSGTNHIYPWDGSSSSYDDPISLLEPNVLYLKDFNNVLYISTGTKANIYRTYGTTVEKFLDISDEFLQTLQYGATVTNLSFNSNELLFFILGSDSGTTQSISGIYAADLATKAYHLKYELSQGFSATSNNINPNAIYTLPQSGNNDIIFAGYIVSGITYIDTNKYFSYGPSTSTRYRSYLYTPLYEVGTFEEPRTFQKMQIILAQPLSVGQGVRVSSRTNLSAAFSNLVTFDSSTIGTSTLAAENPVNVETAQFIQFKIEMQSGSSAPNPLTSAAVYTTPILKSVTIY